MISIFLSHSHQDKPFARELSRRLQAHGIHTWIDEAEMQVGDSLVSKIAAAIEECSYLVVVLSPNSVSSPWVYKEVSIALTDEVRGRRIKVLPLLYQQCDIPGFLADKIYADFTLDFETGFDRLLSCLIGELHEEWHKQKRAFEILQSGYQDWVTFEKRDSKLLDRDQTAFVLRYLVQTRLSLDLLEYILLSSSNLSSWQEADIGKLAELVQAAGPLAEKLFSMLMKNANARLRVGVVEIAQRVAKKSVAAVMVANLREEADTEVRRAILRTIHRLNLRLPENDARYLLETDKDWLTRSYALQDLGVQKRCLLISDETEFAAELGAIAQECGFNVITLSSPFITREIGEIQGEIRLHDMLILVRGEHFGDPGYAPFCSDMQRFVFEGGSLFATAWTAWEAQSAPEFVDFLPFKWIHSTYEEDVEIRCRSTTSQLAQELFPGSLSFRTSYEHLRKKADSCVLFETEDDIPIFGYRRLGRGVCYYLNTCQHSCLGKMPSPLQVSPELRACLHRVFAWIARGGKEDL